jgi:hypothetical protein
MGAKYIDAFGDLPMVVQKIKGEFQCFDGLLNNYLDRCLDLYICSIYHIPREGNLELIA